MVYTLIGVAIAAILYLYSIPDSRTKKPAKTLQKNTPVPENPAKKALRFCPLCGSTMEPGDKLHVELFRADPHDKVFILGCKTCLPGAVSPAAKKDTEEGYQEQSLPELEAAAGEAC